MIFAFIQYNGIWFIHRKYTIVSHYITIFVIQINFELLLFR